MSVPAPSAPPAPGQRKSEAFTVMQRMFDEGFAAGDASVVDQLCSPDLIDHQFGLAGAGAEAIAHVKAAIGNVHAAVPDIAYTIEDLRRGRGCHLGAGAGPGHRDGPLFRAAARSPGGLHRDRHRPGRRRAHRGALGRAGPVRHARPGRRPLDRLAS